MKSLKIAASDGTQECFKNAREVVQLNQTDFTDVAVAVLSVMTCHGRRAGCHSAHRLRHPDFPGGPPPVPATGPWKSTSTCMT